MGYVTEGTCGTCREFEFKGNHEKGYCRRYGAYYWDTDSCSHYDGESTSGSGSGCFLTTACCQYKGLPDDCYELTALRHFRDTYLAATEEGRKLIFTYYEIAPGLVKKIQASPRADEILESIYTAIQKILGMLEAEQWDQAISAYEAMVYRTQEAVSR